MTPGPDPFDQALEATSAEHLRFLLGPRVTPLSPTQIFQLASRLESLGADAIPLRIGVIHTYTSELLNPYLEFEARLQGFAPAIHHGAYGVTLGETQAGSGAREFRPDLLLLMLRWEDLHPRLTRPLSTLDGREQDELAEQVVSSATQLIASMHGTIGGHIVLSVLPPMFGPGLGMYDATVANSERAWRGRVKRAIACGAVADHASFSMLDLDEIVDVVGRRQFFDTRLWYTSRFPFTPPAAQLTAQRVVALGAALKLPRAKVIALDADNTLWGGVIGEDGMNGIALGPDYPGNVFVAFQLRLLDYQRRGFLLALCSKNNPDDVLEVVRRHPHQILREDQFAAMSVNWEPKAAGLQAIARELNVGLDSFVFVDDSDHECLQMRNSLPTVQVVKTPARPVDIPLCLDAVARLEVLTTTAEDSRRTDMYVEQRRRQQAANASSDVDSYLRSLDMRMSVGVDELAQVPRISQLLQKTNQFNLTTRRHTQADVLRMVQSEEWLVANFSLADIFGDSGVVGVALVHTVSEATAVLDSFLMSCRVIGRRAESAFLDAVLSAVRTRGISTVIADYLPTAKNQLAERFLPDHGFVCGADGRFTRDIRSQTASGQLCVPISVTMNAVGNGKNG